MPKSKIRKDRLTILATTLEAMDGLITPHFDMDSYFTNVDVLPDENLRAGDIQACGSTACALGWACTIPAFNREGLKKKGWYVTYKGKFGSQAAQGFFGLTEKDAEYLFDAHTDRDLAAEIKAIRYIIKTR